MKKKIKRLFWKLKNDNGVYTLEERKLVTIPSVIILFPFLIGALIWEYFTENFATTSDTRIESDVENPTKEHLKRIKDRLLN